MPRTLTPQDAWAIAAGWGSYARNGDPGACLYSFHAGDGRPVSEEHRAACLAYVDDLLRGDRTAMAKRELTALWQFPASTPLRPASAPCA